MLGHLRMRHERSKREVDQDHSRIRSSSLSSLVKCTLLPIDNIPDPPRNCLLQTSPLLIECEYGPCLSKPAPIDASSCKQPCNLNTALEQGPTKRGVGLVETLIRLPAWIDPR